VQLKRGKTELNLHWIGALSIAVKNTEAILAFGKHTYRVEVEYHTQAIRDQYVPHASFNYAKSPYEFFICMNPWRKITVDTNMDNHDNTIIIAVDYRKNRVAELTLTDRRIFARLQKGNLQKECVLRVRSDPEALDVCKEQLRIVREQPHILKRWRPNIPLRPCLAAVVERDAERTSTA
jgi:hypothetical protein